MIIIFGLSGVLHTSWVQGIVYPNASVQVFVKSKDGKWQPQGAAMFPSPGHWYALCTFGSAQNFEPGPYEVIAIAGAPNVDGPVDQLPVGTSASSVWSATRIG